MFCTRPADLLSPGKGNWRTTSRDKEQGVRPRNLDVNVICQWDGRSTKQQERWFKRFRSNGVTDNCLESRTVLSNEKVKRGIGRIV